jgi:hypothetical protein
VGGLKGWAGVNSCNTCCITLITAPNLSPADLHYVDLKRCKKILPFTPRTAARQLSLYYLFIISKTDRAHDPWVPTTVQLAKKYG